MGLTGLYVLLFCSSHNLLEHTCLNSDEVFTFGGVLTPAKIFTPGEVSTSGETFTSITSLPSKISKLDLTVSVLDKKYITQNKKIFKKTRNIC